MPTIEQRRAWFLLGTGTLTVGELREWAQEIAPGEHMPPLPNGMPESEPLMVSVIETASLRKGLAGATVTRGALRA